jgi:small-conductance mechanosensitive channel
MWSKISSEITEKFEESLNFVLFSNSLGKWIVVFLLTYLFFLLLVVTKRKITEKIRSKIGYEASGLLDTITDSFEETFSWFLLLISLYLSALITQFTGLGLTYVKNVFLIGFVVQAGVWVSRFFRSFLLRSFIGKQADPAKTSTVGVIGAVGQFCIWILALLLILDNFGVNITALVAGLGIGGIAVALAVQKLLEDFLSSVAIVLDKPFEVGDFIIVGDMMGTVERIGVKTTRMRSLGGEQLVFPNTDLLGSRIRNFKRMYERRVVFTFGVIYQTQADKLEKIPLIVRHIIQKSQITRFDRAHFFRYGPSSLDFEVVYFILSSDYNVYMDIQQTINIEVFRQFAEEGIEFAYPTQTLIIEKGYESA